MKFVYNLVTFLAACVVLFIFGLTVWVNADKVKPVIKDIYNGFGNSKCVCSDKCKCGTNCKCQDCPSCDCK